MPCGPTNCPSENLSFPDRLWADLKKKMYYFEEEILERSQGTAGRKAWRRWPKSTGVLCFFCCLFLFFRFVANYLLFMGWSSCLLEEGSKALGPKGPLGDEL